MAESEKPRRPRVRVQMIYSEPRKVLVRTSISRKGRELLEALRGDRSANATKLRAIIKKKFSRNHYRLNRNAKPIKQILHKL